MSLAIQFIDQPQVIEEPVSTSLELPAEPVLREIENETSLDNVARFEPAAETKLRRANEYIENLHGEILALREELAGAERQVRQRDLLLSNARVREMELRAEFTK